MIIDDLSVLFATGLTAAAAFTDWRTGHIPNPLVAAGFVVGSLLHLLALTTEPGALAGALPFAVARAGLAVLLGVLVCGIGPLLLFRIGAMGGGDVKLLAALGAGLGPSAGLRIELWSFIIVAAYACARLAREGQLLRNLVAAAATLAGPVLPARRRPAPAAPTALPLGPSIFVATVLSAVAPRWLS